mmetsp:Transcript_13311/g.37359  ORF Transcript_13311/g.37359 Transcript_13311/m.37359 type:complete len:105 (+) Transcript_13311:832-1146(+)
MEREALWRAFRYNRMRNKTKRNEMEREIIYKYFLFSFQKKLPLEEEEEQEPLRSQGQQVSKQTQAKPSRGKSSQVKAPVCGLADPLLVRLAPEFSLDPCDLLGE